MLLPELQKNVLDGVVEIITSYTDFTAGCIKSEKHQQQKANLIRENAKFVANSLIPLIESKIQVKVGKQWCFSFLG